MKLHRKRDLKKAGIYCIKNLVNNKVYIGKSVNIYSRIRSHINLLNKESKEENSYFIRAWKKYGRHNFQYFILEYLESNDQVLKERELYWINQYNSTNRDKGYNLRIDSETKCIVSEETREKLSISRLKVKEKFPEVEEKRREQISSYWKNNKDKIPDMAKKVSKKLTKYKIQQYTKEMNLVKEWSNLLEIIRENPNYKKHNIYAACSGEKPTMYGYIWVKVLNDDIVRSE